MILLLARARGGMVDAADLKSVVLWTWGFKSPRAHHCSAKATQCFAQVALVADSDSAKPLAKQSRWHFVLRLGKPLAKADFQTLRLASRACSTFIQKDSLLFKKIVFCYYRWDA